MRTFPDYESAHLAFEDYLERPVSRDGLRMSIDAALPKTDRERVEYALRLIKAVLPSLRHPSVWLGTAIEYLEEGLERIPELSSKK